MSFGIDKCKTQSIRRGHYEKLEYITKEGEIIKNLNKGEFYKYLGISQSNHIQHSIIKENLENSYLCNKLGKGKNTFPTNCTHDFFYWNLENT
jgi:hypothetical protein